ncbi:toxin co-regulated pilus biosynthesis Q family protein [Pseudoalteromonas sp. SMS1]|uniref:TcpQ domain-containing protein n=1 Tax=Pseudoalteromonas sp. SMS1 TaxID=2908894 RepID=UPI001F225C87|nr:TcpQ domain-containing protein [Pseudoalteromonas sp. SMS1]MCF2859001.1 toxin co-regulated pilus biosynthesis Q family protein [Pseudoalteromonas sp. SMS1]
MAKKKNKKRLSAMWFWTKHLSLGGILIWAAYYFLYGNIPKMEFKETTNAAAQGLSQFYANFRNRVNERDTEREKFVVEIGKPTFPLDDALAQRELVVKPTNQRWTGESQPRRFEMGNTLKSVLTNYAKQEDIELFWYLSKDYVVKQNFRVDSDFVSALYQVGRAINDDFEFEVYTFFCHRQRAAVITENPSIFVRENCRRLNN